MSEESIKKEDIEQERTPKELLAWVESNIELVASTEGGEQSIRLREGIMKPIMDEVYPIAMFAVKKYGETEEVKIKPKIGSQNYDAIVTDYSCSPPEENYLEVTLAHEGEDQYLKALHLQRHGYVFSTGTVKKEGTKKTGIQISVEPEAYSASDNVENELSKILEALKRKEGKKYPVNTDLVIIFNDGHMFRRHVDNRGIDAFIHNNALELDLQFRHLYLVGDRGGSFYQYEF